MRKLFVAIAVCGFSLPTCFTPVNAQDDSTHDVECFTSMQGPETSSDEKTRWGAAAAATFYLGRLDQMGLTLEQIHSGAEKIVATPIMHQKIQAKEFVEQCFRDVNEKVKRLKSLAAQGDVGILRNAPR